VVEAVSVESAELFVACAPRVLENQPPLVVMVLTVVRLACHHHCALVTSARLDQHKWAGLVLVLMVLSVEHLKVAALRAGPFPRLPCQVLGPVCLLMFAVSEHHNRPLSNVEGFC